MGERFWVTLEIGGDCTAQVHDELDLLIDNLGPENSEIVDEFWQVEIPDITPDLVAEITDFCIRNKLSWNKEFDAKAGYDPACYWWRPGMEDHHWCPTFEKEPCIRHSDLLNAIESCDSISALAAHLDSLIPPPLPPFRVLKVKTKENPNASPSVS